MVSAEIVQGSVVTPKGQPLHANSVEADFHQTLQTLQNSSHSGKSYGSIKKFPSILKGGGQLSSLKH